jgi:hypothetical protein
MTPLGFERSNIPFPRRKWILGEFLFFHVFSGGGEGGQFGGVLKKLAAE